MRMSKDEYEAMIRKKPSLAPAATPTKIQEIVKAVEKISPLAIKFEMIWESLGGPILTKEYKFMDTRKFRVDYCHQPSSVVIELEGGIYTRQAHGSISGIMRDIEKHNLLVLHHYRPFRLYNQLINSENLQRIIDFIKLSNPIRDLRIISEGAD
jgi:hypothetical protein